MKTKQVTQDKKFVKTEREYSEKIGAYCSIQNWHLRRSEKEQTQERFSSFIEFILKKKSNQEKI